MRCLSWSQLPVTAILGSGNKTAAIRRILRYNPVAVSDLRAWQGSGIHSRD